MKTAGQFFSFRNKKTRKLTLLAGVMTVMVILILMLSNPTGQRTTLSGRQTDILSMSGQIQQAVLYVFLRLTL